MSENSNPQGDETIVVPKAQYDEMVEKLADATQSKANLVAEIQELREKKQLTEAETEELRKQLEGRVDPPASTGEITPEKIAEMVTETAKKLLSERDNEAAKENQEAALNDFLSKHTEFHPENDEGGLKLSALQRKLERFNTSGLKSREDYAAVLEDARNLVFGGQPPRDEEGRNPNPLPPNGGGRESAPVREAVDDRLTPKELQIIERSFGGDKERYLKIKAKRPDYVATLLQYSS